MKKNTLFLLFFVLSFSALAQKNFEGSVMYDITFESINPGIEVSALKEVFGTKLKFSHKDGTYMREYLDANNKTIRKIIYLTETNRLYIVIPLNPDTVYYFDASEKLFDSYNITKGPNDTVLGYVCPSNIIKYRYYEKIFSDTLGMKLEYFFCRELPINPDYYKNYYIWYDIIKEQKSVAIKFTEETEKYFKMTYTATKIEQVKLKKEIFDFNKKAALINQFTGN